MGFQKVKRTAAILILAAIWSAAAVRAGQVDVPQDEATPLREAVFGWDLSKGTLTSSGKANHSSLGRLTYDIVWTAEARAATAETPIPRGTFTATLSCFRPDQDMPGQKAGNWYLQGSWTIAAGGKAPAKTKSTARNRARGLTSDTGDLKKDKGRLRHGPQVARGLLSAELPCEPFKEPGTLNAQLTLTPSPAGGVWRQGQGLFAGNTQFEGAIQLRVAIWPESLKVEGVRR
ncbi:MAG: hypothetical protein MUF69_11865 [Desulfobacterota bacterium]|nr:hypothetical protein [Thermodesulfobacteriota bacterium]